MASKPSVSMVGAEINVPDNRRLADTNTGDETARIDGTEAATRSTTHEDSDAGRPGRTKKASGPNTADAVTYRKGAGCS